MRPKKTAYDLARSQIDTPHNLVRLVWGMARKYRNNFPQVLDLGAGDGRFAHGEKYQTYDGIEIDESRIKRATLPDNAHIHNMCAFEYSGKDYSLCIGNPPYVRHHDLDEPWRDMIAKRLSDEIGLDINRKCNLYVYFILLGLLKTNEKGLVSLLVPYEWASRPSASALRRYIKANGWHVDIYRFSEAVFTSVLTTASISIIDKANPDQKWSYFDVDLDGDIKARPQVTSSVKRLLSYENRGTIWAMRGMSPGTQKVFTLTQGERIHSGLTRDDVLPCVTSLKDVPKSLTNLSEMEFKKHFVDAGRKCWLIKSHTGLTATLKDYLDKVPQALRNTWTCMSRDPWYRFVIQRVPQILLSTGFTQYGPKALINDVGAYAVGSVCGVYSEYEKNSVYLIHSFLTHIDFEKRVVAHSGSLKKLEIRQLNSVLNRFSARYCRG